MSTVDIPLGSLEKPLEVNEPPTAENGRWLYLSPAWWAIVQSMIGLLDVNEVWAGTSEEVDERRNWVREIMLGSDDPMAGVQDVRVQ